MAPGPLYPHPSATVPSHRLPVAGGDLIDTLWKIKESDFLKSSGIHHALNVIICLCHKNFRSQIPNVTPISRNDLVYMGGDLFMIGKCYKLRRRPQPFYPWRGNRNLLCNSCSVGSANLYFEANILLFRLPNTYLAYISLFLEQRIIPIGGFLSSVVSFSRK